MNVQTLAQALKDYTTTQQDWSTDTYREEQDILTDEEIEAMQDDLFAPQDQLHLDRLSYLALNELLKLPQHGWDVHLDPELYDIIHSTLRMENALGIIDIWQ